MLPIFELVREGFALDRESINIISVSYFSEFTAMLAGGLKQQ